MALVEGPLGEPHLVDKSTEQYATNFAETRRWLEICGRLKKHISVEEILCTDSRDLARLYVSSLEYLSTHACESSFGCRVVVFDRN